MQDEEEKRLDYQSRFVDGVEIIIYICMIRIWECGI